MVRKEILDIREKVTYIPLHPLTEQPALIQGGKMKDYQVWSLVLWRRAWWLTVNSCLSCKGWRSLFTCIIMVSLRVG